MKSQRVKFYVEREGWATQASIIFMSLAVVFRLIGCWGLWSDAHFAATQIALPVISGVLFILLVLLFGKRAVWPTALPVLLGVVFFILKSFGLSSWVHTILCILLYLLVAILYTGTVLGLIRTKWLLVPLFALPFLYHVFVEDLAALRDPEVTVSFAAGLQEISVLCIMLSLLFIALAMKKKKPPEVELPKIKDPKVIPPARPEEPAPEEPEPQPLPDEAEETPAEAEQNSDTDKENAI